MSCGALSAALGIITANLAPHGALEEAFHATKKASDFPQELLNLFDLYVHGEPPLFP